MLEFKAVNYLTLLWWSFIQTKQTKQINAENISYFAVIYAKMFVECLHGIHIHTYNY